MWARGAPDDSKAREDLRQFGASDADIARALPPKPGPFEIWPENHDAWMAFRAVQTQWCSGAAGPTGLDYTRARDGLAMAAMEVTPEIFAKLRTIEGAALAEFAKRLKPPT